MRIVPQVVMQQQQPEVTVMSDVNASPTPYCYATMPIHISFETFAS